MQPIKDAKKLWDVVVIGGGPAGMMSAGRAAELGCSVLLLEKNPTLGKKLLLTGGGRCNLTNNQPEIRPMLLKYKNGYKFLFPAFAQFGVQDTLDFFNQRGIDTKEEEDGRIFPADDMAQSVLDVLIKYTREGGVRVQTNTAVVGLKINSSKTGINIKLKNGAIVIAKACVVATGGLARPETGSTGDGFIWLKEIGHTIVNNDFALVPIALKSAWTKKLTGITLNDIKLTIFQNGQKKKAQKGKLLFTHFGVSGPTILNLSKEIGELLKRGKVVIALDLLPELDHGELKKKFQSLLSADSNKQLKNVLSKLIPQAIVDELLRFANINGATPCHSVRHADRIKLIDLIKSIPLDVKGLLGADQAIISSGGVDLKEVDFKTMRSRLVPNLYVVGDALNIDRPSGGYSLQICWTTGFVAGSHCCDLTTMKSG